MSKKANKERKQQFRIFHGFSTIKVFRENKSIQMAELSCPVQQFLQSQLGPSPVSSFGIVSKKKGRYALYLASNIYQQTRNLLLDNSGVM